MTGSHATLAGWEPKECSLCGDRIYVSKHSAWYHWSHLSATALAFHAHCFQNNPRKVQQLLEDCDREPLEVE